MSYATTRRELMRRLVGAPLPNQPAGNPPIDQARHVLNRATFGPDAWSRARIAAIGWAAWLDEQLAPDGIDDSVMTAALLAMPSANNQKNRARREYLFRCARSRRQLQHRMLHFLSNHFNTDAAKTHGVSEVYDTTTYTRLALGSFVEVLLWSAKSPAMVVYLDSQTSLPSAPNENYARELMELHTLGVYGGFSEPDVVAAAKIFTGWRVQFGPALPSNEPSSARFVFLPFRHVQGPKVLPGLGYSTPGYSGANGVREGEEFLSFLAVHPSTQAYITLKLCQYFVADVPPVGLVQRVQQVFASTNHLGTAVRAIFHDPEFFTPQTTREKGQDSIEFMLSTLRRLEVTINNANTLPTLSNVLGQPVLGESVPTGTPEESAAWQGPGQVLPRWNSLAAQLGTLPIGWSALVGSASTQGAAAITDAMLQLIVDGDVPTTTRLGLEFFLSNRLAPLGTNPSFAAQLPHIKDLAGLILRLPEAQLH